MTVLVDTSVWSLALRRRSADLNRAERQTVDVLRNLIDEGAAAIAGPIRQELLSGIRDDAQFHRLRELLSHVPHVAIEEIDYDRAAECHNACRRAGVAATAIDMLLCAVALRIETSLLTIDADFKRYARVVGVDLLRIA